MESPLRRLLKNAKKVNPPDHVYEAFEQTNYTLIIDNGWMVIGRDGFDRIIEKHVDTDCIKITYAICKNKN